MVITSEVVTTITPRLMKDDVCILCEIVVVDTPATRATWPAGAAPRPIRVLKQVIDIVLEWVREFALGDKVTQFRKAGGNAVVTRQARNQVLVVHDARGKWDLLVELVHKRGIANTWSTKRDHLDGRIGEAVGKRHRTEL